MTRIRAADDFAAIRARMKELAREADAAAAGKAAAGRDEHPLAERERRQTDRRDGRPPPWAPTIFAKPLIGRR